MLKRWVIFKSPGYTGADYIFLYRFVRRRRRRRSHRRRPQTFIHKITFEKRFGFLSFLARCLNFQGLIWNLLNLSHKWSDCHETKSKHIDCTLCLKCDHRVRPWTCSWPWIFKVKYGVCYISNRSGPKVRYMDAPDSEYIGPNYRVSWAANLWMNNSDWGYVIWNLNIPAIWYISYCPKIVKYSPHAEQ